MGGHATSWAFAVQIFKDPYLFDFLGTDAPRRYVVIELKARKFEAGDGAQLGMYMTAVGLLLVREKNRVLVEYALAGSAQLTRALPQELKGSLPTIEEIEAELSWGFGGWVVASVNGIY